MLCLISLFWLFFIPMMTPHYLHQHICRRHTDSSSEKIKMQVQHLESTPELLSVMFLTK